MSKKIKETEWGRIFAWLPVHLSGESSVLGSIGWLIPVERRWVQEFYDGQNLWAGFYQYRRFKK